MEKKEQIQTAFRQNLFSGDTDKILNTINSIREMGSSNIIEPLFDLYATNNNEKIKKAIFSLIIDIKAQENADIIVSLLHLNKYESLLKDYLSMCWQSNLDFSAHIDFFAKIIISKDFHTAFEAFTVVEECIQNTSNHQKEALIAEIKEGLATCPDENKELLATTIKMLAY